MKPLFKFSSNPLFILGCAILAALPSSSFADTYRGRVDLRGTLVSRGQETDISVKLSGYGLSNGAGDEFITMNGGGLYTIKSANPLGRYAGRIKLITNHEGTVKRKTQKYRIRVTRRSIKFKDGRIRLKRPINVTGAGRYRLRGKGQFRVNA